MKKIVKYFLLVLLVSMQAIAADVYQPNSGDNELDEQLQLIDKKINRRTRLKLSNFVDKVAQEFQVPVSKVEALFNHYEFKAPDVLMSVSIADVSGEPLNNVSSVYFKNKDKGWKYTLMQMNIVKGSKTYKQIKKDMMVEY